MAIALGVILELVIRRGLWLILRKEPPQKEEEREPERVLRQKIGFEFGKREEEETGETADATDLLSIFSLFFSVSASFGIFYLFKKKI